MTMIFPPAAPGSFRRVPHHPNGTATEQLRIMLCQDERWVLRGDWGSFLAGRKTIDSTCPIVSMTTGQRVAALSWLHQQQHALHRVLEGTTPAPDGWLESQPLVKALQQ